MALLELDEARALIETDRSDAELSAIIAREEAMMVRKLGAHGDGSTTRTEVLEATGGDLFLPTPAAAVTSVGGSTTGWTLYGRQGRIAGGRWSGAGISLYPAS